jgi:hypothetical protein
VDCYHLYLSNRNREAKIGLQRGDNINKRERTGERRNKGTKKRRKTVGGDGRGMGPVL